MRRYFEPFCGSAVVFFQLLGMQSPLKWVGSKRQLADKIVSMFPKEITGCTSYVLNDVNHSLAITLRALFSDTENFEIIQGLRRFNSFHKEENANHREIYANVVSLYNALSHFNGSIDTITLASAFIYLNKMGFNGLYRENSKGKFNVSFGDTTELPSNLIESIREYYYKTKGINIHIYSHDFESILNIATSNDFVYLDPPYLKTFSNYSKGGFNLNDHARLAKCCHKLNDKGAKFILSGLDSEPYREWYPEKDGYIWTEVEVRRSVSCKSSGRGKVSEVLIANFVKES